MIVASSVTNSQSDALNGFRWPWLIVHVCLPMTRMTSHNDWCERQSDDGCISAKIIEAFTEGQWFVKHRYSCRPSGLHCSFRFSLICKCNVGQLNKSYLIKYYYYPISPWRLWSFWPMRYFCVYFFPIFCKFLNVCRVLSSDFLFLPVAR